MNGKAGRLTGSRLPVWGLGEKPIYPSTPPHSFTALLQFPGSLAPGLLPQFSLLSLSLLPGLSFPICAIGLSGEARYQARSHLY